MGRAFVRYQPTPTASVLSREPPPATARPMGYTHWLLVQQSDLTFQFVTDSRYGEFHAGRGTLPQARSGEVRTVELVLHLERRAAEEVIHVDHRRFPVLASGRRDPASMESEMDLIRDIVGLDSPTRPKSARRRWATRQMECAYRWTPTAREAREIADLVSRRAKRPLLGGRPLRLVESDSATSTRASCAPLPAPPIHGSSSLL